MLLPSELLREAYDAETVEDVRSAINGVLNDDELWGDAFDDVKAKAAMTDALSTRQRYEKTLDDIVALSIDLLKRARAADASLEAAPGWRDIGTFRDWSAFKRSLEETAKQEVVV